MISEFDRIEEIISEFLTLAKPEAAQYKEHSMVTIIEKTLSIIGSHASFNNITIQKQFDKNLPNAVCKQTKMKQVFINLFKNAIEAMPTGGTLSIQAKQHEEQISIQILDTGCGIPEERISKLDEPFKKEQGLA
jgi:two-component system, sporulation sensor kinase E